MLETDLIQAQAGGSKDLLIALHGLGDSMDGYRWIPRALQIPSLNILLVNAPDAYFGGYSWYDFAAEPGPGIERSYRLMEELLQDWFGKGYSADRTILFGFSQGCLMCYETGIRHAQRFAGLIGVSGYVHEPDRLLRLASPQARSQNFLVTHGTNDALIPLAQVRPQVDQLRAAGLQIDFRTFEKDHTIVDDELVLFRDFIQEKLPPLPAQ